jgi:hypothetical protein
MSKVYAIEKFLGVNNRLSNHELPAGVLSEASNVGFSEYTGSVSKIAGYGLMESSQTPFDGLSVGMFYADTITVDSKILAATTEDIYEFLGTSWSSRVPAGQKLTGTRIDIPSWTVAIDATATPIDECIIFTNGKDQIRIFKKPSGTQFEKLDDGTGTPIAWTSKFVVWWENRLWCIHIVSGANEYPDRIYYSGIRDCEDWTGSTSGYVDINLGISGKILGATVFRNKLTLLCAHGIVVIDYIGGTDIIKTEDIPVNFGCIAPGSVITVGNLLYYLSFNGIASFNGNSVEYVTEDVWNININGSINYGIEKDVAVVATSGFISRSNELVISYPTALNNYRNYGNAVFNIKTRMLSFNNNTFFEADGFVGDAQSYFPGDSEYAVIDAFIGYDRKVYYLHYGNLANGSNYQSKIKTGWISFGNPSIKKRILKIDLVLSRLVTAGSNGTVAIYTDFNATTSHSSRSISVPGAGVKGTPYLVEFNLSIPCRSVFLYIYSALANEGFVLNSIYITYDEFEGNK